MENRVAPIAINFSSKVKLTLHDAFLSTAGLLQCEPVATLFVMTVQGISNTMIDSQEALLGACASSEFSINALPSSNETLQRWEKQRQSLKTRQANNESCHDDDLCEGCCRNSILESKEVAHSTPRYFTSRPNFNETFCFEVEESKNLTTFAAPEIKFNTITNNNKHNSDNDTSNTNVKLTNIKMNNISKSREREKDGKAEESLLTISDCLVIVFTDIHHEQFYGAAYCPFSLHCNSNTLQCPPTRVTLYARNAFCPYNSHFINDNATLKELSLNNYGFVNISWQVTLSPRGGIATRLLCPEDNTTFTSTTTTTDDNVNHRDVKNEETCTPTFPLGLAIRAEWLYAPISEEEKSFDNKYTVTVEFGEEGIDRFVINPDKPLCFTLNAKPTSDVLTFYCTISRDHSADTINNYNNTNNNNYNNNNNGSNRALFSQLENDSTTEQLLQMMNVCEVSTAIRLLPVTYASSYDRDVHYTCALRSENGTSLGVLNIMTRLSHNSLQKVNDLTNLCPNNGHCTEINNPLHQLEYTHSINVGLPEIETLPALPQVPQSSYQHIYWEDEAHKRGAEVRHDKQKCICDACPTKEHVRHVFDVLLHRVALDENVAQVASLFSKCDVEELTPTQLKEFMVGLAFYARRVTVCEAARFCFFALRHDVEDAIAIHEVEYILWHCLLPHTLDLPEGEVKRYVRDLFGVNCTQVSYENFRKYVLLNYAMWSSFGVPMHIHKGTLTNSKLTFCASYKEGSSNSCNTSNKHQTLGSAAPGMYERDSDNYMVVLQATDELEKVYSTHTNKSNLHLNDTTCLKNNNNNNNHVIRNNNDYNLPTNSNNATRDLLQLPFVLSSAPMSMLNTACPNINNNYSDNNIISSRSNIIGKEHIISTSKKQEEQLTSEQPSTVGASTVNKTLLSSVTDPQVWRNFVVRLVSNKKGFSVTAHVNDTIQDVMKMIEATIQIPCNKQEWRLNNETYLDPKSKIGETMLGLPPAIKHKRTISATAISSTSKLMQENNNPIIDNNYQEHSLSSTRKRSCSSSPSHGAATSTSTTANNKKSRETSSHNSFNTVWIRETEEMIDLTFICRDRHKRWQERFAVNEKILRVRAAVQRVTRIPLSRCVLRLRRKVNALNEEQTTQFNNINNALLPSSNGTVNIMLADRHRIAYYAFEPNDVIEVYQG